MDANGSGSQTLLILRLVWGASIMTQAILAIVVIAMVPRGDGLVDPQVQRMLVFGAAAALLILTPVGYFVRNQIYKAHWREHAIAPGGYFSGNIALMGMMEGVSFASIVIAWMCGQPLPAMYVAGAAVLVLLINFPTGRPMEPTPPVFGERDRP